MTAASPLPDTPVAMGPADLRDVEAMARLINRYAAMGVMLPRSRAELYRLFREYAVVTGPSGELAACGGLRVYSTELAEIVGLAVEESWQGRGLGRMLLDALVSEADALGIARVFALTVRPDFFRRAGFAPVPRERLPEKLAADCRSCARRAGCHEVAVLRVLRPDDPGPMHARQAPGGLRVLEGRG